VVHQNLHDKDFRYDCDHSTFTSLSESKSKSLALKLLIFLTDTDSYSLSLYSSISAGLEDGPLYVLQIQNAMLC
jgi:hypothetical protein